MKISFRSIRLSSRWIIGEGTFDWGKEMATHERLGQHLMIRVFFTDPHCPWQRGTNENTNGLLRQYLPRGTDLSGYTQRELTAIAYRLSTRSTHVSTLPRHWKPMRTCAIIPVQPSRAASLMGETYTSNQSLSQPQAMLSASSTWGLSERYFSGTFIPMPRGPRKLTIKFGTTTLTHYGGRYLLHRFLSRFGFKDGDCPPNFE